ncbi:MAG: hypothetical protein AB7V18_15805 [Pyrinomonadaceae bacterium]
MQSVESIYQQSIRLLPIKDQLRLAELIKERVAADRPDRRSAVEILQKIQPSRPTHSVAEIDTYLRSERDSWDD